MQLMLWTRDEGNLDDQFRDGDIFQVHDDTWIPGTKELQRFLIVQMPDHPGSWDELVASEYSPGAGGDPVIRRMRKYRVPYALVLDSDELAAARDRDVSVDPIGGGRFTLDHIVRK